MSAQYPYWATQHPYPHYQHYPPPPYPQGPYPPPHAVQPPPPPPQPHQNAQSPAQGSTGVNTAPPIAPTPSPSAQPGQRSQTDDIDAHDDDSDDAPATGSGPRPVPGYTKILWDRTMRYSNEGVAELRKEWQKEYATKPMPPPPPEVFSEREAGVAAAKKFARDHGYGLTICHSNRDKDGVINRVLLGCTYGGKIRDMHANNPEARVRKRFSRKTDCQMKMRLQKRRFNEEWVMCISRPHHNHASDKALHGLGVSEFPDLEAALHDWHLAELAKGETPHGNTLKSRAIALFAEMPQYRGNEPPNLDRKWLDNYRRRYGLPGKLSRPSGPPQLVDWEDPAASAAAAVEIQPRRTRENTALNGLEAAFDDPALLRGVVRKVKEFMSRYDASHDWDHILRVVSLTKKILRAENAPYNNPPKYNPQVVYLAALCHDLGDHKYAKPDESVDNQIAELLLEYDAPPELALKVQLIARNVSFSNEIKNPRLMKTVLDQHLELAVVQDADRLDAIGAVGIARTFCFSGAKMTDRSMVDTIEHFQDKLERLEGMMKTKTGKEIARQRTERLQTFRGWWNEEYAVDE